MLIELDPSLYTEELKALFGESLSQAGIQSRSGASGLYGSLKVTKIMDAQGERIVLSFNDYGVFLDEGVQGKLGGATGKGAGGFQFYFKKGQGLPTPTRPPYSGYGFGIKARPWVAQFLAKIETDILPKMGEEIFLDLDSYVEQQIQGVAQIQIKGNL